MPHEISSDVQKCKRASGTRSATTPPRMKFYIDGLLVYFPYSFIYPEQYDYMVKLKQTLDARGSCALEMPTGTGKTVSLLALIISYQTQYEQTGKLIYCCRTVSEVEKTVEELRRVLAYRDSEMGVAAPKTFAVALSARKNLCVNDKVVDERRRTGVDARCQDMTATWRREQHAINPEIELCEYYEGFQERGLELKLTGVYSLDDLKDFGRKNQICPYFYARHSINFANVVIYSYQYMLNPRISDLVSAQFKKDCIVVFDEAHNIDNVCIDALSVNIDKQIIETGSRNLSALGNNVSRLKTVDAQRLQEEYQRLVSGLAQNPLVRMTDTIRPDPVLPEDVAREAVPENIHKAEEFLRVLRNLLEFLRGRLRMRQVTSETPAQMLKSLTEATQIDAKTLRFCTSRLNSLMKTLQLTEMDKYTSIGIICDFFTMLGTYNDGFVLIMEPYDERNPTVHDPVLQFSCLDASLAWKPVITKYGRVVITSGTLSPLDMLPRILGYQASLTARLPISLIRPCICPMVVTRGSDQTILSTKFESRDNPDIIRNYGQLLLQTAQVVPDGIVAFFTSYTYMEATVSMWNEMGILNQLLKYKLLFVETSDFAETSLALDNYRKACDSGRGAIFLSVARGKVSEGIDFDNHYGRCVLLFGIPFVYTESKILKARLEYLRNKFQIKENEFLTFDAMRNAGQCVGRVIRGKTDYGIMIFADKRYGRVDKRSKLPQWISQFLNEGNLDLSIDAAISVSRSFLKEMAQPIDKDAQVGVSLWSKDHIDQQPASRPTNVNNNAVNAVVNSQLPKLPPTVVFSYVPPANENVQSNGSTAPTNGSTSAPPAGVKEAEKMDEENNTPGPNIVFKPIVNDNNYIPVTTGSNYSNYNNNNTNTRSNNNNNNDDYEQMELIDDDD